MNRFDWLEIPSEDRSNAPTTAEPLTPLYDEAHYLQIADQSWHRGDFEKALRFYAKALGQDSTLEEAWVGQVRCLLDLDEVKEARLWVNKSLETFPRSALLLSAKAVVLSKMMEDTQALEASSQALAMKHQDWYLWLSRGLVLSKKGDRNTDYCLSKALETNPKDGLLNLRVGMVYMENMDYHKAHPFLRQAVQTEPTNPLMLLKFGICSEKLGWVREAQDHFRRALKLDSELHAEVEKTLAESQKRGIWGWVKSFFQRQRAAISIAKKG